MSMEDNLQGTAPSAPRTLNQRLVRAGAGAGKTTNLTTSLYCMVEEALARGEPPARVVVTTFTRKATRELQERLVQMALAKNRLDLVRVFQNPQQIHISTIHSVLIHFLEFAFQKLGFGQGINVTESFELLPLRREAFRRSLGQLESVSLLVHFEIQDLERAVRRGFSEGLDLLSLPARKEHFQEILTLSRHGLEMELADCLAELSAAGTLPPSYEKARQAWQDLMQTGDRSLLAPWQLVRERVARMPSRGKSEAVSLDLHERFKNWLEKLSELLTLWSEGEANGWQSLAELNQAFFTLVGSYRQEVQAQIFASGKVSTEELETLALFFVQAFDEVVQGYSLSWDHWMIDEYQDTSRIQEILLQGLMGDRSRYFVGDPQQSIYLFRGAKSEIFVARERALAALEQVEHLRVNYRSEPQLLNSFNELFRRVPGAFQSMEVRPGENIDNEASCLFLFDESEKLFVEELRLVLATKAASETVACLVRTHKDIARLSRILGGSQIPYLIEAGGELFEHHEVVDLILLGRFLINPRDDETLFRLLRSPWFRLNEQLWSGESFHQVGLWKMLCARHSEHEVIRCLEELLSCYEDWGIVRTLEVFLLESGVWQNRLKVDVSGRAAFNLSKAMQVLATTLQTEDGNPETFFQLMDEHWDSDVKVREAPALESQLQVSLQTIHASKGLQYDYVFVLGLAKEFRSQGKDRLFQWDERNLFSLNEKSADLSETLANPLMNLVKSLQRQDELAEHYRLFYVAATRAKRKLFLWIDEAPRTKSWLEALQWPDAGEGEQIVNGVRFRSRWGQWSSDESETEQESSASKDVDEEVLASRPISLPSSWSEKGGWRQRIALRHLTSEIGSQVPPGAKAVKPEKVLDRILGQFRQRQRGIQLHWQMELLAKSVETEGVDLLGAISDSLSAQPRGPELLELLPQGHAEWDFVLQHFGRRLAGRIDWWAKVGNEVWLVDYKSGRHTDVEKAFAQLQFYAAALQEMGFLRSPATQRVVLIVLQLGTGQQLRREYDLSEIESQWLVPRSEVDSDLTRQL